MPDICTTRSTSVLSELFLGMSTQTFSARKPSSHTEGFSLAGCIGVLLHVTVCFAALCQPSTWIAGCQLCCAVGFLGQIHDAPASGSSPFPGNSYSSCWLPFILSLAAMWIFFGKLCLVVQPLMLQLKNLFTGKVSSCQQLLPEQLLGDVVVAFRHLKARRRSSREDSWLTFSSYSRQIDFWSSVISSVKARGSNSKNMPPSCSHVDLKLEPASSGSAAYERLVHWLILWTEDYNVTGIYNYCQFTSLPFSFWWVPGWVGQPHFLCISLVTPIL